MQTATHQPSSNEAVNRSSLLDTLRSDVPEPATSSVEEEVVPRQLEMETSARLAEIPELSQRFEQIIEEINQRLNASGRVSAAIASPEPSVEVSSTLYTIAELLRLRTHQPILIVCISLSGKTDHFDLNLGCAARP